VAVPVLAAQQPVAAPAAEEPATKQKIIVEETPEPTPEPAAEPASEPIPSAISGEPEQEQERVFSLAAEAAPPLP
jgi:hypothetical protein